MINMHAGPDMRRIFTPIFTPIFIHKGNGNGDLVGNKKAPTGYTIILITVNPADPLTFIIKRE